MRSIDPKTGRTRPAQRSGTSKFNTPVAALPGTGRVQNVIPVTFDTPTSSYSLIAAAVEEWRALAPSGRSFVSVEAKPGGGVVAMDDQGAFTFYSSDGETGSMGAFPKSQSEIMCKCLILDIEGGLVSAASTPGAPGAGRVFRMREVEGQGWVLHWELSVVGRVVALAGTFGNVYVATDALAFSDEEGEGDPATDGLDNSKAHLFAQGLTSLPVEVWSTVVAYPVKSIAIGPGGSLYVTSSENDGRDIAPTFNASVVKWTPRAIADQTRIYHWWDASKPIEVEFPVPAIPPPTLDGDPYTMFADNRPVELEYTPPDFYTGRNLYQFAGSAANTMTYELDAFALPGARFGKEAVISVRASGRNPSASPKASTEAAMPGQRTTFPGYTSPLFTTYMVIRGGSSAAIEVFLQQNTRGEFPTVTHAQYGILMNSNEGATAPLADTLWMDIPGATDTSGSLGTTTLPVAAYSAHPSNAFLLTFQHGGDFAVTGEYSGLRINGTVVDRFKLSRTNSFDVNGGIVRTIYGNKELIPGSAGNGEMYQASGHSYFSGWFGESITVLAEHDAGIHDSPPASPILATVVDAQSGTLETVAPTLPPNTTRDEFLSDAAEMEHIEGYLAHKWGIADLLPSGVTPDTANGNGFYPNHPFGVDVPGGSPSNASGDTSFNLQSTDSILAKYTIDGTFAWAHAGSGMGYGVAYYRDVENEEDWVFSCGNVAAETGTNTNGSTDYVVRKIKDLGPGFSVDPADGAWLTDSQYAFYDIHATMRVATNGDIWFATGRTTIGDPDLANGLRRYAFADGLFISGHSFDTFDVPGGRISLHRRLNGISLDPDIPSYGPGATKLGGDNLYGVIGNGDLAGFSGELVKLRILDETRTPNARPRSSRVLAVRGGEISVVDRVGSPVSLAVGALDAGEDVYSVYLFQKVYFLDGKSYKVYDPYEGANGTVTTWEAKEGAIPKRARLICAWRGRIVLARFENNPTGWAMSRVLDPLDWNESPDVVTVDQPVTGRTAPQASDIPDIVNSIIAYNDDLLIFGCDSSIYRLTGDPMLNGQIDLISDVTGIAFGTPHTKDPSGILYFFGSKGGVWAMPPGGLPTNLVERRMERDLQDLDRSLFKVQMQWNYRDEGLHVFVIGLLDGATHESWFWDKKNDAWWPDTYGHAITTSGTFDGDGPDDRAVLLGCEDGYVRFIDKDSATDDGTRIDSSLLIGPVQGRELRVLASKIDVLLDHDQGPVTYECFTGASPSQLGDPVLEGSFGPGYNDHQLCRVSGNQFWLKLRSSTVDRWALESIAIYISGSGRRHGS
jgi:hypothetical protein